MQAKSGSWRPMSKKKDRGWFICPQWAELISRHYASDIEAGRALKADPKVLSKLRSGTPVAKSTVLTIIGGGMSPPADGGAEVVGDANGLPDRLGQAEGS